MYDLFKDTFDHIEKNITVAAKKGEKSVDVPFIDDGNLHLYSQYLREHGFVATYNSPYSTTQKQMYTMHISW